MSSFIQIGPEIGALGFANRQKAVTPGTLTTGVGTPLNYTSVTSVEARLAAINGTYFTAARLNQMTQNDKNYALRLLDDPTTI